MEKLDMDLEITHHDTYMDFTKLSFYVFSVRSVVRAFL